MEEGRAAVTSSAAIGPRRMGNLMFSRDEQAAMVASIDDLLAEYWGSGQPLSAAAEALGFTRSAVAGRISRARKRGDERFPKRAFGPRKRIPKPAAARPRQKPKPIVAAASPTRLRNLPPAVSSPGAAVHLPEAPPLCEGGLLLVELRPGQCKFAVNDSTGLSEPHRFCSAAAARSGASCCSRHEAMMKGSRFSPSPSSSSPFRAPAPRRGGA